MKQHLDRRPTYIIFWFLATWSLYVLGLFHPGYHCGSLPFHLLHGELAVSLFQMSVQISVYIYTLILGSLFFSFFLQCLSLILLVVPVVVCMVWGPERKSSFHVDRQLSWTHSLFPVFTMYTKSVNHEHGWLLAPCLIVQKTELGP